MLANRVPNTRDARIVTATRMTNAPLRCSVPANRSRRFAASVASSNVRIAGSSPSRPPVAAVTTGSAGAG